MGTLREYNYASILNRVEAGTALKSACDTGHSLTNAPLDQHALLWRHPAHIFPPVVLIPQNAVCLPVVIRVFKCVWDDVVVAIDATKVTERERLVVHDMVNRPPKIDDLKAPQ